MEDAAARRARLKAMREEAETAQDVEDQPATAAKETQKDGDAGEEAPVLKFRNYAVRDEKIAHEKVEAAKAPELPEVTVDLDAVIGAAPDEEVIINVAPKKANWDLRRDIAPKLAKLERRTQRAMIQLMAQEEERRLSEAGA